MRVLARALDRLGRDHWRLLWRTPAGRAFLLAAIGLVVVTVIGLLALWPGSAGAGDTSAKGHTEPARVTGVSKSVCEAGQCRLVEIELLGGSDKGRSSVVTLDPRGRAPEYDVGQRVRVLKNQLEPQSDLPGAVATLAKYSYSIVDYDRRLPMLWLALAFSVLVILAARVRGVLALVGLGVSLLIVTQFVIPAIVDDKSAFLVALIGSLAAMLLTIALTSGAGVQSLAAALGIAASLFLASALGLLYVHVAHLTGQGTELAQALTFGGSGVSLQGLVLAGFVIGTLGVLADTGVTQASTVMALRRANPGMSLRRLYSEAFTVGRDHLSATVHTLVFAYVGASLPLLLLFKTAGVSFTDAINSQEVAEAVVATLVGSIGIIASVPFTTGLAAAMAMSIPADEVPADDHAHHH